MKKDGLEVLKAVFPISICSHVASCGRASSILTIEKSIATLDFREAPFHVQSKACPMMIDRKSHLFLLGKFFTLKCDVLSVTQKKNKNIEWYIPKSLCTLVISDIKWEIIYMWEIFLLF